MKVIVGLLDVLLLPASKIAHDHAVHAMLSHRDISIAYTPSKTHYSEGDPLLHRWDIEHLHCDTYIYCTGNNGTHSGWHDPERTSKNLKLL